MFHFKLVFLLVIVGVALAEFTRNLQVPQDLGTPTVCIILKWFKKKFNCSIQCMYGTNPCSDEDYDNAAKFRETFIDDMVNKFVDEDVQPFPCFTTKSCSKDEINDYNSKRAGRFQVIYSDLMTVNHL